MGRLICSRSWRARISSSRKICRCVHFTSRTGFHFHQRSHHQTSKLTDSLAPFYESVFESRVRSPLRDTRLLAMFRYSLRTSFSVIPVPSSSMTDRIICQGLWQLNPHLFGICIISIIYQFLYRQFRRAIVLP